MRYDSLYFRVCPKKCTDKISARWVSDTFSSLITCSVKFCKFRVACTNEMNCGRQWDYYSDMVTRRMIAGLANTDHQSRVLTETATLTTLEQKFNRLVKSTPHFHNSRHHLHPRYNTDSNPHANTSSSPLEEESETRPRQRRCTRHNRGARGVVVIVVENGHGDTSSNPGRDWLNFT